MPHCWESKMCFSFNRFQWFSIQPTSKNSDKLKKAYFCIFIISLPTPSFQTSNHRLLMIIQLSRVVFALGRLIHLPTLFLLRTLRKLPFVHQPTSKSMVNYIFLWYKISFGVKKKQLKKISTVVIVRRLLLSPTLLPSIRPTQFNHGKISIPQSSKIIHSTKQFNNNKLCGRCFFTDFYSQIMRN